ncbi:MAG: DNA-processing protein DprA, partial [Phycisphaerae bacterium]
VGARRASYYGLEQARRFGQLLAQAGLIVVSGLARGIDSAAHRGALDVAGRTIAVLGNGLAEVYPPEHRPLADQIAASGALLSELPMRTAPDSANFPRRNRLIAGMGLGVLVVEAGKNSGALITARLANDYNREVFAVPGRIDLPNSRGTNGLIRDGQAKLVIDLEDILDELGPVGQSLLGKEVHDVTTLPSRPVPATLSSTEKQVLAVLSRHEAMPIESICQLSGATPAQAASALTMLQLKGAVRHLPGSLFISLVDQS